jgi:hypothetical protein
MAERFTFPVNVYTSIPGVKVPGVRVPQLEHIDLGALHNCTKSKPLTAVFTYKVKVPKFTPSQLLLGIPEVLDGPAPMAFKEMLQVGLKPVGQLGQNWVLAQSL